MIPARASRAQFVYQLPVTLARVPRRRLQWVCETSRRHSPISGNRSGISRASTGQGRSAVDCVPAYCRKFSLRSLFCSQDETVHTGVCHPIRNPWVERELACGAT